jgi:hypothetical protein
VCASVGPGAVVLEGDHCKDLSGAWYNNLGSEMILNTTHHHKGFIFGEYRTAVERTPGAAGDSHSIVVGTSHAAGFRSREPNRPRGCGVWGVGVGVGVGVGGVGGGGGVGGVVVGGGGGGGGGCGDGVVL